MGSISTTGLTALVAGEDWHYVGDTDEPAFQNSWANSSGNPRLAFRAREAGIVDVQGTTEGGTAGTVIFTLPAGYRPTADTAIVGVGFDSVFVPILLVIGTGGDVTFTGEGSIAIVVGQIFLDPPSVA